MIYHKINTLFKRDMSNRFKTLLFGQWTCPEFEYLADNDWDFTEKVDGTNIRIGVSPLGDGYVKLGGRTDDAQIPTFLYARLLELFMGECQSSLASLFPYGGVLYGEGYGAKIQKGGSNYLPHADFVLFDVLIYNEQNQPWWLRRGDVDDIAAKLSLRSVPVIDSGSLDYMVDIVRGGLKSTWGDFTAEGIVARPSIDMFDRGGRRIITKLKHRDFQRE